MPKLSVSVSLLTQSHQVFFISSPLSSLLALHPHMSLHPVRIILTFNMFKPQLLDWFSYSICYKFVHPLQTSRVLTSSLKHRHRSTKFFPEIRLSSSVYSRHRLLQCSTQSQYTHINQRRNKPKLLHSSALFIIIRSYTVQSAVTLSLR